MNNRYNFYNLEASFKSYLLAGNNKIAPVTAKNYLSDLRHFLGWFLFTLKASPEHAQFVDNVEFPQLFSQFLDREIAASYKKYLEDNKIPLKTVNRRLSTLRKFCSFCISQDWLKENPAKKIQNLKIKSQNDNSKFKINEVLNEFKGAFGQAISDDVRDFLNFIR